jgi:tellurite methyltransferase
MNGGYDDGYRACPCFWGNKPGSLVLALLREYCFKDKFVLDLGCGEGKNAAALARAGARVTAVDCSELAVANGKKAFPDIEIDWQLRSVITYEWIQQGYDVIIMYGLLHCLPSEDIILETINNSVSSTKPGGLHILVSFNNRHHDLSAHPNLTPTLLPHSAYASAYSRHNILTISDSDLHETHPHNNIPHHHSLTRLIAQINHA